MIASNRELANTLFIFDIFTSFKPATHNNINMDIEIDTSRGQLNNSSTNNSREPLVHSGISSVLYAKRMETLNNSSF